MQSKKLWAHFALLVASFIFGGNYWVSKTLMPEVVTPFQLLFLRVLGAGVLFFILSWFAPKQKVEKSDLFKIFIAALLGIALNQAFFFKGLERTSPVDASIIHVLNPIIVMLLSALFLREKIRAYKIVGIALGTAGALSIILYSNSDSAATSSLTGNILILMNCTAYASYLVVNKPLLKKYHTLVFMKWIYIFGVVLVIPFTINTVPDIEWANIGLMQIGKLLYVIILTTFGAYYLTIIALKYLSPLEVSFYIYLQPVLSAVIAFWLYNEEIGMLKIIASILIFSGVLLVTLKKIRKV